MTDSPGQSRPQQVTTAVVISVAACVLAVVNLFNTRDELRGTTMRDSLADAQDRTGGLGVSNDQLVAALEVLVFVSGALAAAAAVLAIYAWQRNRAAWIGFFVLAGLLALTLPVAGVLPVLLLASGVTFLASRPARDWFAGRAPAAAGSERSPHVTLSEGGSGATPGRPEPPPYPGRFGGGSSALPPSDEGSTAQGGPAAGRADVPPAFGPWHGGGGEGSGPVPGGYPGTASPYDPGADPVSSAPYPPGYAVPGYGSAQPYGRDPDRRPGTVTTACAITWVATFLVAALLAVLALVLAADRSRFLREFQRQAEVAELEVTQDQILAITWTFIGIGLVWCLAAAVLAVLAFRRSSGGRIGLVISAAMTVLVSLLLILSFVAVVPLLLAIAVLALLFTGGANDWYARRPSYPRSPQPGPPPPQDPRAPQQPPPPTGRPKPW